MVPAYMYAYQLEEAKWKGLVVDKKKPKFSHQNFFFFWLDLISPQLLEESEFGSSPPIAWLTNPANCTVTHQTNLSWPVTCGGVGLILSTFRCRTRGQLWVLWKELTWANFFRVIEHPRYYFSKWLKIKNRRGSKNYYLVTSLLMKIESRKDEKLPRPLPL